jgi:hypothetical protein
MNPPRRRFLHAVGLGALAGLAGCQGLNSPPETTPDEGDLGLAAFPGMDSIGFSYDVFGGKFASPESTRVPLFDLGELVPIQTNWGRYRAPDTVRIQKLEGATITATSGTRSRDYQTNLASRVGLRGGYGFFRGSLDLEFNEVQRRSTVFTFVTQNDEYNIALLTIDPSGSDLRDYVRSSVADDLATMDPVDLFDTYGTHFLRSLIAGAAATYSAATNVTEYESDVSIAAAAKLSYLGATGQEAEAEMEARDREAIQEFRKASTDRGARARGAGRVRRQDRRGELRRLA